jgi:hypothetical protein
MFAVARADSGIIRTNMVGLACFGCRFVMFEMPDDLGSLLCKIGPPRVLDDQGLVEIPFIVWPTLSAWSTTNDEADAPDQIPDLAFGGGLTIPDAPTAATVVEYPDESRTTRVGYSIPEDASTIEATYRTYTGGIPNAWQAMTEHDLGDGTGYADVDGDLEGVTCDFRIRTFSADGNNGSAWSDLLNVTLAISNVAPAAPDSLNGARFDAPTSLNVAYVTFNDGDPIPCTPGERISTGFDTTHSLSAFAYSSNGTASPEATYQPS